MTEQERKKRPTPQRSAPRRAFIRHDHPTMDEPPSADFETQNEMGGLDNVIGNAVNLAYRVVDEQLQQGRHAARRVADGAYRSGDIEDDVAALARRFVRSMKDAAVVWLDLISTAARTGRPPPAGASTGTGSSGAVSVDVRSSRPVQVTLDLCPTSARFAPVVHALYPKPPGTRSLTDVSFRLSADSARCVLVITVPDDLAPGTYTGVVVDRATHAPGGTLCVCIHPKE